MLDCCTYSIYNKSTSIRECPLTRTGRPPKPIHLRRTKMMPVKVTEAEERELKALAFSIGTTVSDLMRDGARLLGKKLMKGKGGSKKGE